MKAANILQTGISDVGAPPHIQLLQQFQLTHIKKCEISELGTTIKKKGFQRGQFTYVMFNARVCDVTVAEVKQFK